jgi:hypothetical protein
VGANEERAAARRQRVENQRRLREREWTVDPPAVLDTPDQIREFQELCMGRVADYPDDHPDRLKTILQMGELDARVAALSN